MADDLKKEVDAAIAEAKEASGSADAFYTAIDRGTTTMASDRAVVDAGNTAAAIVAELRKHNAWRAQRDAGEAEAFVRRMHEWQERRCAAG